jgi:hypothetical protein
VITSLEIDSPDLMNVGDLWGRGWSLIPLRYRGKRPACGSGRPTKRLPIFEELEQWFGPSPDYNIGIVTGTVSGIFVLDCDSPEAMAWAGEHLPPCEMRVRTARGVHLYYPYSGDHLERLRSVVRGICFTPILRDSLLRALGPSLKAAPKTVCAWHPFDNDTVEV